MSDELSWKRWTPDDLSPPSAEFTPAVVSSDEGDAGAGEPELSEEEQRAQLLAQMQMQAHEQGFNAGMNEGRQTGHAQGYQEGLAKGLEQGIEQARQQQAPLHARMQQLVSEFQHTLDALDSVIAARLMQMALEAARHFIMEAVRSRRMRAIWMPASRPAGRNCAAWRHRESSDDRSPYALA